MNEFEKKVRKAMIDRNVTTNQLAKSVHISLGYLYDILAGNRIAKNTRKKICEYLDIEY